MRLFWLSALTMTAFAANSILNRLALAEGAIGAAEFAVIRIAAGALTLSALVAWRAGALHPPRPDGAAVAGLALYMICFSFAYVAMDAGLGALILFAGVQVTMFTGALIEGERPPLLRWLGMGLALTGLAALTLPGAETRTPALSVALMSAAALGWGIYSLQGRRATDPLASTGWNFVYALPVVAMVLVVPVGDDVPVSATGVLLAIASGAVTSALGYSLWYALLPRLGASVGALAQLSVPVIAVALGALLLEETVTPLMLAAMALILGGIALGLLPARPWRKT